MNKEVSNLLGEKEYFLPGIFFFFDVPLALSRIVLNSLSWCAIEVAETIH